jgi:hypothetical protein
VPLKTFVRTVIALGFIIIIIIIISLLYCNCYILPYILHKQKKIDVQYSTRFGFLFALLNCCLSFFVSYPRQTGLLFPISARD